MTTALPAVGPARRSEPSKEMRAALKVLDDHLQKKQAVPAGSVPQELRNAFSIVQLEWFKVTGAAPRRALSNAAWSGLGRMARHQHQDGPVGSGRARVGPRLVCE